jgi:hypothetical protein
VINNHEQKHWLLDKYLVKSGVWAERPGGPVQGDLYRDTDRGSLEFFWDVAAANWLSTTEYPVTVPFVPAALAATGNSGIVDSPVTDTKIYVTKVIAASITAATYDVTNNWSLQIQRQDNTGVNQNVGSAVSNWATGRLTTRRYLVTSTINSIFTVDTQALLWIVRWVKNGAPGNVSVESGTLWFRVVG